MSMPAFTSMTSHSQTNRNDLPDVSFTSCLNGAESSFFCKLAETSPELIPRAAAQEYHEHHHLGRKKAEDGEIGVFSAEKYFAAVINEGSPRVVNMTDRKYRSTKDEQKDAAPEKLKVHPGTPIIRSKSCLNSQSALLQAVLRNPSRRKMGKGKGKSFLGGLGCKCPCSDKDSVDVHDHAGEISFSRSPNASVLQGKSVAKEQIKISIDNSHKPIPGSGPDKLGDGLDKETCFTFPIPSSSRWNLPIKKEEFVTLPRKSLEVFGSPIHDKRSKSFNLERRLPMLSLDGNPRVEAIEFSAAPGGVYNDNESDASSDLFEIESFSGKVIPFPARVSDATSGCATPKTCYAPSEASIEWSVVTAGAADFSVVSDYEELRPPAAVVCTLKGLTANANTRTELTRRRPGVLLGCKSQEAIKVAGDVQTKNDKANFDPQMRRVSDSHMPVTRFRAETKHAELNSTLSKIAPASHKLP